MKEKLSHLYVIENLINGKKYFGITTQNPATKRWIGHKTVAKRMVRKTPLYLSMRKYGFQNFDFKVIESSDNKDYIANLEIKYIKEFGTQNIEFGYNLSDGGEINIGYKIPKDIVDKQKERMMEDGNHFYGKHHSYESKLKISKSKLGKKMSEETRAKMKGRKSPMKGVTGENHHAFGKERPNDVKKSIQINTPHRKEVLMLDSETGMIIMKFLSKKSAGQWLIDNGKTKNDKAKSVASGITRAINNNSVSYGYRWLEVDERQSTIETAYKRNGVE